jgi:hypothetical protein
MAWNQPGVRVLLDACCLINLLATDHLEEILRTLPCEFATSRFIVTNEVISLRSSLLPGGPDEREIIASERLERTGCLAILDAAGPEETAQVARFGEELDDGEASICALAVIRGGVVATDDAKALRVLQRLAPDTSTVQTPELLFEWARITRPSSDQIAQMLEAVRHRARFHPRRNAPRFAWWDGFFR